ncbi:hypothetical protein JIG36_51015 [Actinoplanes sp. LDG1-06]|uniref:Uncharacterized protein n=1 Tax=Paractinoplanes ovalisporus TaxID=2810368 RepID=A0ABS2AVJ5_9ACTN|nr:hypothetical protein [Actinoplanes ovalisporus]MBM2623851.1 hypothetical protein [Actinoplanes ovalisporus]
MAVRDVRKSVTLDSDLIELARKRAGLPEDTSDAAVIRYALAMMAGADELTLARQLDSTKGKGSPKWNGQSARRPNVRPSRWSTDQTDKRRAA